MSETWSETRKYSLGLVRSGRSSGIWPLFVSLTVRLSVCLSVCLFVSLTVRLSVCLSVCLFVSLTVCLSICLCMCMYYLTVYVCVCVCVCIR